MLALGAQLLVGAAAAAAAPMLALGAVEIPIITEHSLAHDKIGSLLDARASVSDISAALEGVADLRLRTAIDDTGAKIFAEAMRWNASLKSLSIESTKSIQRLAF